MIRLNVDGHTAGQTDNKTNSKTMNLLIVCFEKQ